MPILENLNRVELQGRVGHDARISSVGDSRVARFSLVTNEFYRTKGGEERTEATWHSITVWESPRVAALDTIKKGAAVHLKGRLRCNKYTDAQGNERSFVEVLAFELQVLDESAEEGNQQ